jgi:methionyl-tRNA formyltransferase
MQGKDLRIVYMGTPAFAVEPLKALHTSGYNISAVVTSPDKPAGRGQKLSQSAVKEFALTNGLKLLQPTNLKEDSFAQEIKSINPHVIVVVAFRMLPEVIWRIPIFGTFNLHASLLPQYRGAAPINWAIINGENKTGVTTFLIDDKIDTGKILMYHEVDVDPNETAGELHDKLMPIGADLVLKTIDKLALSEVSPVSQDELLKKVETLRAAPKLFKENTRINWKLTATEVHNLIRGLSPYPAAWTSLIDASGVEIQAKILNAQLVDKDSANNLPGDIQTDGKTYIKVKCVKGTIALTQIQLAGKRNLPVKDFLLGYRGIEKCRFL